MASYAPRPAPSRGLPPRNSPGRGNIVGGGGSPYTNYKPPMPGVAGPGSPGGNPPGVAGPSNPGGIIRPPGVAGPGSPGGGGGVMPMGRNPYRAPSTLTPALLAAIARRRLGG